MAPPTDSLVRRIREVALLEGDFVLRSGRRSRYYLDKYRLSTRPDILAELGQALAAFVTTAGVRADRIAAPEVGAIPLAAAASLASGVPFVIVRGAAKSYGTGKRIEGPFAAGESVVLLEDVVTSGGAAIEAIAAVREAGLVCDEAICVVDREEGGSFALAAVGVRLRAIATRTTLGIAE